jgi:hypothetical protein
MLDVHPPHHAPQGVRDFFIHLFTITVGLLIALGLEGCVEQHRKTELRKEAELKLVEEVKDNEREMDSFQIALRSEIPMIQAFRQALALRQAKHPYDASKTQLTFPVASLSEASWKTASSTGAVGLMNYGLVQDYAATYSTQEQFEHLSSQVFDTFLTLQSYVESTADTTPMDEAAYARSQETIRRALIQVVALKEVGDQLEGSYKKLLVTK